MLQTNGKTRYKGHLFLTVFLILWFSTGLLSGQGPNKSCFVFDYAFQVEDIPAEAKDLQVWIPIPAQNEFQKVELFESTGEIIFVTTTDPKYKNKLYALIVRETFRRKKGVNFFTPNNHNLQFGYMKHKKNHFIKPHRHIKRSSKVFYTSEVIHILKGKLREAAGFGDLRFAISGAAPINPDIITLFHRLDIPLYEGYGMTGGDESLVTTADTLSEVLRMKLYVNAIQEDEDTTGFSGGWTKTDNNLLIGSLFGSNRYFKGDIDEFSLWNYALDSTQIGSYMHTSPMGNEDGLVGYWKFNAGSGDILYDHSGNGNHGTINGAEWVCNDVDLCGKCGGDNSSCPTITDIDGNLYETVQIGNQNWMKQNLKVSHYNDGSEIPTGLDNGAWSNTTEGAYTIYDDDYINVEIMAAAAAAGYCSQNDPQFGENARNYYGYARENDLCMTVLFLSFWFLQLGHN